MSWKFVLLSDKKCQIILISFAGYITANYQFLQDEISRVAPGCTPVRRRRGSQSQTPAKKLRGENGAPLTIEEYAQELIEGELAQRLFQVTQKIHKKLPEHVSTNNNGWMKSLF
jgi:DNA polymerase epsilon subunit 1